MNQINELEKYKKLLDDGAINEEEFRRLKQNLLGLKTDAEKEAEKEKERALVLEEIERLKAERLRKEQEEQAVEEAKRFEEEQRKREDEYQETLKVEKAREQARVEVKKEQMQNVTNNAMSLVGKCFSWLVAVFFALMTLGSFMMKDIINGCISILLVLVICPPTSEKLKEISKLEKLMNKKGWLIVALLILFFVTL